MSAYTGWEFGIPPIEWLRILSMDTGGATANHLTWSALDPNGYLIAYDEINYVTTDMRKLADMALPKMKHPSGQEFQWKARIVDYENKVAADDMGKYGIQFDNAIKHNKLTSVQRLTGYLHPNPRRPFPDWHPRAGQPGSPLLFILDDCRKLIQEIPLQRWKPERNGDSLKDEMDRSIRHDAVDTLLYIVRLLPTPKDVPIKSFTMTEDLRSLQSKLYWEDVKRRELTLKQARTEPRKKYNPIHANGGYSPWSR
jgi:hypothetical protein